MSWLDDLLAGKTLSPQNLLAPPSPYPQSVPPDPSQGLLNIPADFSQAAPRPSLGLFGPPLPRDDSSRQFAGPAQSGLGQDLLDRIFAVMNDRSRGAAQAGSPMAALPSLAPDPSSIANFDPRQGTIAAPAGSTGSTGLGSGAWASLPPHWGTLPDINRMFDPPSPPPLPAGNRNYNVQGDAPAQDSPSALQPTPPQPDAPLTLTPEQQRQLDLRVKTDSYLQNSNVQAWLNTIGFAEGANYNSLYGNGPQDKFGDFSQFPGYGLPNTPSGKYQILEKTYGPLSKQLGVDDFSPHTQDLMAVRLLIESGAMPYVLSGNFDSALSLASRRWGGLPKNASNRSYYPNQNPKSYLDVKNNYYAQFQK